MKMKKKNDLLLIIDMQNVYLPGEEWSCPSMVQAIQHIKTLLDADCTEQVAFTRFVPPADPVGTWMQYNEENYRVNQCEYLNEIVEDLKPYLRKWPVYEKSFYSSFKVEELMAMAKRADRVVISGVVAECCVLATLMDSIDAGHKVVYLTDCVSGQSEENEAAIQKIAESFAPVHTIVTDSKTYLEEV